MSDKPVCLLALDGGGVRGLSELIILDEIMKRIQVDLDMDDDPLPADFFDLIGGTSTGGLNALLLGRLRLSVPEAKAEYVKIAKEVFKHETYSKHNRFEGRKLENAVKQLLQRQPNGNPDERMMDRSRNGCKVFVCAVPRNDTHARAGPRLFRTYRVRENQSYNCTIWEASRATSAAPRYFESIAIGDEGEEEDFLDGGLGYNNPTNQLLEEAQNVYPGRKVACIVSIGTGLSQAVKFPDPSLKNAFRLLDALKEIATNSDRTAEEVGRRFQESSDLYHRFDVDRGLSNVKLEEWKNLHEVRTYTTEYTKLGEVSTKINKVVTALLASKVETSEGSVPSVPVTQKRHEGPKMLGWNPPSPFPQFLFGVNSLATTIKIDATCEASVWLLPFGRNAQDLVGREDLLRQVLELIQPCDSNDDCQRTVIEGLGGVGKTRIATETAFRFHEQHPEYSVYWVAAVDVTSFENSYRDIGRSLKNNIIQNDETDIKIRVKAALSNPNATPWLLIVDNADDPNVLFAHDQLMSYLPSGRKCSILFTTAYNNVTVDLDVPESRVVKVARMSRSDALRLLRNHMEEGSIGSTHSDLELLEFLECLPLAIRQASSTMRHMGISSTQYLRLCKKNERILDNLLQKDFYDRTRYQTSLNSVARAWLVSFQTISRTNKFAAELLKFISFLAERQIPISLLPKCDNTFEMTEAIGVLKGFNFIEETSKPGVFDSHRLVRLSMRMWLDQEGKKKDITKTVINRLEAVFPDPKHGNKDTWETYLAHVQYFFRFWERTGYKQFRKDPEERSLLVKEANLKHRLGVAFQHLGKNLEAKRLYAKVLKLTKRYAGKKASEVPRSHDELGRVLGFLDKHDEARYHYEEALRSRKKKDPERAVSINGLGMVCMYQRNYSEAETRFREALKLLQSRSRWGDKLEFEIRNNLGLLLSFKGNYKAAKHEIEKALEGRKRCLGPEHPVTLESMNSLGLLHDSLNDNGEAITIHRATLRQRERILGRSHSHTLDSMNNLAKVLKESSNEEDEKEAESLLRKTLEMRVEVLGPDHTKTKASVNNLVDFLEGVGRDDEAIQVRQTYKVG